MSKEGKNTSEIFIRRTNEFRVYSALKDAFTSLSNLGRLLRIYLTRGTKPYRRLILDAHFRLIKSFIDSIENDNKVPVTVDEGILSIRLAKAIEESIRSGKEIELSV